MMVKKFVLILILIVIYVVVTVYRSENIVKNERVDRRKMDHTGMTHDHHDHGDHDHDDHCGHDGHSHSMVFHAGVCQEILFNGWMTTNALELFGSCVVFFVAGILYEALKYYRERLHSGGAVTADSRVNITKNECGVNGSCSGPPVVKYTITSCGHIIQTLLHVVQSTVSYTLMLVFMTYNVWLCLSLVLGLGAGYFIFGWRRSAVVDSTEHCQ